MQFDSMRMNRQPGTPLGSEVVTWPVVDDQEHFAAVAAQQRLQEPKERLAVEHVDELVGERRILQGDRPVDVRRSSLASGWHSRLLSYSSPSAVQCGVELEAGFVLEQHDPALGGCFFLIAGSLTRSQYSWAC